jgi:hypothetical protein
MHKEQGQIFVAKSVALQTTVVLSGWQALCDTFAKADEI